MERLERFNTVSNDNLVWIDINEPSRSNLTYLSEIYPLHVLNIEDCLSKTQIPKIDRYENQTFIVINYPIYEGGMPKHTQLSIFVGPNYVITVHSDDIKPLTEMFNNCKEGINKASIMGNSSGYLLYKIIDNLVDELLHILVKIEGNIDDIEDLVFDENISAIRFITYIRHEIIILRRIILPLRRIVNDVAKDIQRFSTTDLMQYINDIKDHVEKAIEILEVAKETIDIFKDTDFILNTEKTNKILAVLTIVFTLSIPATLISTFYGMNVNLPGGIETGSWTFLGQYTTFIVLILVSVAAALLMAYIFYKRRWFF